LWLGSLSVALVAIVVGVLVAAWPTTSGLDLTGVANRGAAPPTSPTVAAGTSEPSETTTSERPLDPSDPAPTTTAPGTIPTQPPTTDRAALPRRSLDPSSLLVLVNNDHPLPEDWEPTDLVAPAIPYLDRVPQPERQLRAPAANAAETMLAAAASAGVPLIGVSAYRSAERQRLYWSSAVRAYGEADASRRVARPGRTEHQTGLALDVTTADGRCPAQACFGATPAAAWLRDHAADHGYVVRYPPDKEPITGYQYEPWHLRYVGVEAATALVATGMVLDELPLQLGDHP
jgi:zinc D-Ala-D-Ala carboxypeptidase